MQGHAEQSVERYCELAPQICVTTEAGGTAMLRRTSTYTEELETVSITASVCAHIVLTYLYFRDYDPTCCGQLWTADTLARTVTKLVPSVRSHLCNDDELESLALQNTDNFVMLVTIT